MLMTLALASALSLPSSQQTLRAVPVAPRPVERAPAPRTPAPAPPSPIPRPFRPTAALSAIAAFIADVGGAHLIGLKVDADGRGYLVVRFDQMTGGHRRFIDAAKRHEHLFKSFRLKRITCGSMKTAEASFILKD